MRVWQSLTRNLPNAPGARRLPVGPRRVAWQPREEQGPGRWADSEQGPVTRNAASAAYPGPYRLSFSVLSNSSRILRYSSAHDSGRVKAWSSTG